MRIFLWRRGKSPHRWKSRSAGERALRYHLESTGGLSSKEKERMNTPKSKMTDELRFMVTLCAAGNGYSLLSRSDHRATAHPCAGR